MLEVVSDFPGLRALGEEWNALAARFASPFLSHAFNVACAEAFCESPQPAVHVLRSGGRIAAIAPPGRLWGLKIGYNERFRRVSPGTLLDCEVLRHACERGYEAYEFPRACRTVGGDLDGSATPLLLDPSLPPAVPAGARRPRSRPYRLRRPPGGEGRAGILSAGRGWWGLLAAPSVARGERCIARQELRQSGHREGAGVGENQRPSIG